MIDNLGKTEHAKTLDEAVVDLVVQIACLALLAYWTVILLQPLLGVMLWSVILAVLLYPAFDLTGWSANFACLVCWPRWSSPS